MGGERLGGEVEAVALRGGGVVQAYKLIAKIDRCPRCGIALIMSFKDRVRCPYCREDYPVVIQLSGRRKRRTYAGYECASHSRLLRYLATSFRREYGVKCHIESYLKHRYLSFGFAAIVVYNSIWPVDRVPYELFYYLRQRYRYVYVVSSSWIKPEVYRWLRSMGIEVVKVSVAYRMYMPHLYRYVKQMESEMWMFNIRVVVRFTLKALRFIVEKLLRVLYGMRALKLRGLKPPAHYEVKGLGVYAELHIHEDAAYLCKLYGLAWVIDRLDNHALQGLLTSKRIRRIDRPLCRGELAPEGFRCP